MHRSVRPAAVLVGLLALTGVPAPAAAAEVRRVVSTHVSFTGFDARLPAGAVVSVVQTCPAGSRLDRAATQASAARFDGELQATVRRTSRELWPTGSRVPARRRAQQHGHAAGHGDSGRLSTVRHAAAVVLVGVAALLAAATNLAYGLSVEYGAGTVQGGGWGVLVLVPSGLALLCLIGARDPIGRARPPPRGTSGSCSRCRRTRRPAGRVSGPGSSSA